MKTGSKRMNRTDQREVLEAFSRDLMREAHNLRLWPELLWQQMYNRLQWEDGPEKAGPVSATMAPELDSRRSSGSSPWIHTANRLRESEAYLLTLAGHAGWVTSCDIFYAEENGTASTTAESLGPGTSSKVEKMAISASADGTLRLWDLDTGRTLATFEGHPGGAWSCAFSPDGKRVLSAGQDKVLKMWDVETEKELATLEGHADRVTSCAFSPDGRFIVSASRKGLSESELLDILSADPEVMPYLLMHYPNSPQDIRRLPFIVWYRFYRDLAPYLSERVSDGVTLLCFYHRELDQVAVMMFLEDDAEEERHRLLAEYFNNKADHGGEGFRSDKADERKRWEGSTRAILELPYHLSGAREWENLYSLLGDPAFIIVLWGHDQLGVKTYWFRVEEEAGLKMAEAYQPVLSSPTQYEGEQVLTVALLLRRSGHPSEALPLHDYLISHFRESGNKDNLRIMLESKVPVLRARGDLDGALELLSEQETLCREPGNEDSLAICLFSQANILYKKGMRPEAIALAGEAYQIAEEHCRDSLVKQIRVTVESLNS